LDGCGAFFTVYTLFFDPPRTGFDAPRLWPAGPAPQVYDFEYRAGLILSYEIKPLPDWVSIT
jgi:hypothetical protein